MSKKNDKLTVKLQVLNPKGEVISDITEEGYSCFCYIDIGGSYNEDITTRKDDSFERFKLIANLVTVVAEDKRLPKELRAPFKVAVLELEALNEALGEEV
jgi:hypothetical protein